MIQVFCLVCLGLSMTCAETYNDLGDALRPALVERLRHPSFGHFLLDFLHLSAKLFLVTVMAQCAKSSLNYLYLSPVLWFEIIEPKPQFVEFPREVEVPQRLDERHMDEEFKPAGLSRCGELVEELSHMNGERGEHPTYGKDGPLGVVMVRVTVIQRQINQECINVGAYIQRRQH